MRSPTTSARAYLASWAILFVHENQWVEDPCPLWGAIKCAPAGGATHFFGFNRGKLSINTVELTTSKILWNEMVRS